MKHGNVAADYRHKHIKNLVCSIQNETKRGYKVIQMDTNTLKTKIAYYYNIDFCSKKGIWEPIPEEAKPEPPRKTYVELKQFSAKMTNCFWAFSLAQLEEGLNTFNLTKEQVKNYGGGLIGTEEGVNNYFNQQKEHTEVIRQNCTPQEIYQYEYYNFECDYLNDDSEALNTVAFYFPDRVKEVIRKF